MKDDRNERALGGHEGAWWPSAGPGRPAAELDRPPRSTERERPQCLKFPTPTEQLWHLQGLAVPSGAAAPLEGNMGLSETTTCRSRSSREFSKQ